jgi:hypothetical protein
LASTDTAERESVLTLAFRLEAQILVCAAKKGALLPHLKKVLAAIKNQTIIRPFCAKILATPKQIES